MVCATTVETWAGAPEAFPERAHVLRMIFFRFSLPALVSRARPSKRWGPARAARTALKVDPADRSRETSQPSMRKRMEKRYDNDGWQAMEIGRDGERRESAGTFAEFPDGV